jgi:hypothetical protein
MRCDGVVPLTEIAAGVAAAKVFSAYHDGIVITKSGGLGDNDVLRRIGDFALGKG